MCQYPLIAPLVKLTRIAGAKMNWKTTEFVGVQNIVWRYGIEMVGWPSDVPFLPPHALSTPQRSKVIRQLEWGRITFRWLDETKMARFAAMTNSTTLSETLNDGQRSDKGEKRARLIKTDRLVASDED